MGKETEKEAKKPHPLYKLHLIQLCAGAFTLNWNLCLKPSVALSVCKCFLSGASAIDLWFGWCLYVTLWTTFGFLFFIFLSVSVRLFSLRCVHRGNQIGGLDLCKLITAKIEIPINKWHFDNSTTLYLYVSLSLCFSLSWCFISAGERSRVD